VERPESVKALRVYLRQSKEEDSQRESIPTQRAECERLAKQLGLADLWSSRVEYVDMDRSGADFVGREELNRLLAEAREGDTVLTWKQDRVGRDMIDSASAIRELVKFRRCDLYSAETGTVRVSLDSAEETALVMFRGMVAQGELERIRSRTRAGLRQRARDGFATGKVPYGYRCVLENPNVSDRKQSKKRIEIDEKQAAVVRRIFSLYLDGRGVSGIARLLNVEGMPSPKGKGWSRAGVWETLRNPRYVGEWSYGEERIVARKGSKEIVERAPESEVIRLHRPELAIVSEDVWAKVQAATVSRSREMPARYKRAYHLLTGTMVCDECGGPMSVKKCHGRHPRWARSYYVCRTRLEKMTCGNKTRAPVDEIEPKVIEYLRTEIIPAIEAKVIEAIRAEVERVASTTAERAEEADRIRATLEALRRERQRLVRVAAASDDPVAEVMEALKANQDRAKEQERALAIATQPPIDLEIAKRIEAVAIGKLTAMKEQLATEHAREVLISLFPSGLRFKVGPGLWRLDGAASVPHVNQPDMDCPARTTDPTTVTEPHIDLRAGCGDRGWHCACYVAAQPTETYMRRLVQLTPALALVALAAMPNRRADASQCTPSRMFIVLDHSSSMNDTLAGGSSKWTIARQAVETVATAYESKIELGLNVFPRPNQCSPGQTLVQPALNNATAIKNALPGAPPASGNYTPMAQTIDVVAAETALADAAHRPSILLITDGWQWCSPYDAKTRTWPLEAVQRAAQKGIKVYVVGFGGAVDVETMNKMAVAAGTARPNCDPTGTTSASPNKCYYQADSLAQLNAALDAISIQVSAEVCDGLDNDCDGQVDEGLTRNCASACGGGTEQCVNGVWGGCDAPQPVAEICDGKDNDCDGTVDEGCGSCTPGTTRACGTDVGACAKGTQTCTPQGEWTECAGMTSPMAETCNGVDDDCDGEVDNGPPGGLCPAGQMCDSGKCVSIVDDSPPSSNPTPPAGPVDEGGAPKDGCGCRIGGARADGNALPALLVLAGLGMLVTLRRGRRGPL
jgi:MYXO-CTERM domain-containing protein